MWGFGGGCCHSCLLNEHDKSTKPNDPGYNVPEVTVLSLEWSKLKDHMSLSNIAPPKLQKLDASPSILTP